MSTLIIQIIITLLTNCAGILIIRFFKQLKEDKKQLIIAFINGIFVISLLIFNYSAQEEKQKINIQEKVQSEINYLWDEIDVLLEFPPKLEATNVQTLLKDSDKIVDILQKIEKKNNRAYNEKKISTQFFEANDIKIMEGYASIYTRFHRKIDYFDFLIQRFISSNYTLESIRNKHLITINNIFCSLIWQTSLLPNFDRTLARKKYYEVSVAINNSLMAETKSSDKSSLLEYYQKMFDDFSRNLELSHQKASYIHSLGIERFKKLALKKNK